MYIILFLCVISSQRCWRRLRRTEWYILFLFCFACNCMSSCPCPGGGGFGACVDTVNGPLFFGQLDSGKGLVQNEKKVKICVHLKEILLKSNSTPFCCCPSTPARSSPQRAAVINLLPHFSLDLLAQHMPICYCCTCTDCALGR